MKSPEIDPAFLEAWINGEHTVLGRKLRPFCLWHSFLLRSVESPFVSKGVVLPIHLRQAVAICSLGYPANGLALPKFWWWWATPKRFAGEVEKFTAYVGDFLQRPEYDVVPPSMHIPAGAPLPKVKPPKRRGQPPEELALAWKLMARMSEQAAWELPMGMVHWYVAMADRENGMDLDFMTPEDKREQEEMRQKRKAREAEKEAQKQAEKTEGDTPA